MDFCNCSYASSDLETFIALDCLDCCDKYCKKMGRNTINLGLIFDPVLANYELGLFFKGTFFLPVERDLLKILMPCRR